MLQASTKDLWIGFHLSIYIYIYFRGSINDKRLPHTKRKKKFSPIISLYDTLNSLSFYAGFKN